MTVAQKFSRLQKRGQVTIPIEIRQSLGLEEGDLVAFFQTDDGVLISPQEIVPSNQLNQILDEKGIGLDDLFSFVDRIKQNPSVDQDAALTTDSARSIVERTAGVFYRQDRDLPDDFKQLREAFIEETTKSVRAETPADSD
jgi:AbrB family looped-hinge helix DNA binding protein